MLAVWLAPGIAAGTPAQAHLRRASAPAAVLAEGYRAVATDGGVFDFGTNRYLGSRYSLGITHLNAPMVGMAPTSDGGGYWLVAADGGVFSFGDAGFYGSEGSAHLNKPVVGIAATSDGGGYWLVAADGGVFSFGDAGFYGSEGGAQLNSPVVGMASMFSGVGAAHVGGGYWLVGADGGIFTFGAARFHGALPGLGQHVTSVVGVTPTIDDGGYWEATSDGTIYAFGDARFLGDFHTQQAALGTPGTVLNGPWDGLTTVAPPGTSGGVPPGPVPTVGIALAPGTSADELVGATAQIDVTVDLNGAPVPDDAVTVTVFGPNARVLQGTTAANGVALVSYAGTSAGVDALIATSGAGRSTAITITWSAPVTAAATEQVTGNFFAEPAGTSTFVAKPGDAPAFSQTFPDIAFDPPQGLLPIPPGAPNPATVPFTDVVTDAGGAYAGTLPAAANGYQAGANTGAGDLTAFDAALSGKLTVAQPGYLTLGVISADGFLFGVGGGASAFSGALQGAPASGRTSFAGYPLVAASNSCIPATVDGSAAAPGDFPVTIHLPAAGTYPYEIDYFSCDTQSGGQPLRSLVLRAESLSPTAPTTPTVYIGYGDTTRLPNNQFHYFPYPWGGSPGVAFEGCSPAENCQFDGGAVRVDNTTNHPMTVDDLHVVFATTAGPYAPYNCTFDIWPNQTNGNPVVLAPGSTAIYAQEGSGASSGCGQGSEFDTSDVPNTGCTQSQITPVVQVDIGGTTTSYDDTGKILNTAGVDKASCSPGNANNESTPWTRVGGPGVGADVPLPPSASLTLAPIAAVNGGPLTDEVGTSQPFTVSAVGSDGHPISGITVNLVGTGANPVRLQALTDGSGIAHFSYTGTAAGTDTLAASANYQGLELASGQTTVTWQIPVPGPGGASSGGTPGEAPPAIAVTSLPPGTVLTEPTPVTAAITPPAGQTTTAWSVQLSPAGSGQGTTATTLASGTGAPPAPPAAIATIDPTRLVDGTYNLTITATASGGGSLTNTQEVMIGGTFKPGRYQALYQDLTFPAPGFTIGVQRAYDSIAKAVGDFGAGWRLQLSDYSVGLSGPLGGGGWTASPTSCNLFGCQYTYHSSTAHTVTITTPSGSQEVFDFTPSGGSGPLYFLAGNPGTFTAQAGTPTTGTLTVYQDPGVYYGFDGNLYNALLSGTGIYDPTEFIYTEPNGTRLLLSTTGGLLDELQPDGNCLDLSSAGVRSFTGVPPANLAGCGGGAQGPSLTFNRDSLGRVTSITTPTNQTFSYTYDSAGDLITVTPPAPTSPDIYTYDANHDLLTEAGPGTPLTTLTYDSSGRLTAVTDAAGHTTTVTNNVGQRQQVVADPNGQLSTVYTYDPSGDLLRQDRTAGSQTLTDTYSYDSLGDVTSHTDPLGHTTTATYDGSGNLSAFTDADGHTTQFAYNGQGQVTSEVANGATVYQAAYTPSGETTSSTDGNGATTTYAYNSDGLIASVTDPASHTQSYGYDGSGNLTSVSDAAGHTTTMAYDAMGHLTSVINAAGATTAFTYDSDGRLLTTTDANGHVTTTNTYNSDGQLVSEANADGGTTTYSYSTAGQLAALTRPGQTNPITYTYDTDSNVTAVTAPDGSGATYAHDAFGRLTGATNANGSVALGFDRTGNLTSQTTSGGAQPTVTLTYGYDPAGNRTSLAGPGGTTHYAYDSLSRLASITDPAAGVFGFSYDAGSLLTGLTRPNGVNDKLTYDAAGGLTSRVATLGAATVASSSYTYTPAELEASMTNLAGPSSYTYDGANQLTAATHPVTGPAAESYTYDPAGNRTSSAAVPSFTYDPANQLTSDTNNTYTYDPAGDMASATAKAGGAVTDYTWNDLGQLVRVQTPSGVTSYLYDALGRRIEVDTGTSVTRTVYDGSNVALQYNGNNQLQASYTTGLGTHAPLEMSSGGQHYYYVTDGAGSVTALTAAGGTPVDSYTYDAFGNATKTGTLANPLTYTGQVYDPSDGLYYYGARYYDSGTGRFISPDPVPSANAYPYVGNDPTNFVDPTGAEALVEDATITLYNQQLGLAQDFQKLNACLAGQLLYAVLAMRGYAVSPPDIRSVLGGLLPNLATDAAENQLQTGLDLGSQAYEDTALGSNLGHANTAISYIRDPADAFRSQILGFLFKGVGLPEGLGDFADGLYKAGDEAAKVSEAAQEAANGDPCKAIGDITGLCNGGG
jgi:RHS repeat-associated protein